MTNSLLISRGEVLNGGLGISRYDLRKAEETGELQKVILPGRSYGKYRRSDIVRVFGLREEKANYGNDKK
jgi:hypothetical protein